MMQQDVLKVLLTEEELAARITEVGELISRDYKDKKLLLVGVLKGSMVFMADLMRAIDIDVAIDFMATSSYGSGTKSSGVVKLNKDLDIDVRDYDVLLIEDILDSGRTLSYLLEVLEARGPKSLKICTLLDKPERRGVDVPVAYTCFTVPDEFVIGYGLDFDEKYRNLPYIGVLKPEVYAD